MKHKYNPKDIEEMLYKFWEKNGYFSANTSLTKKNFCIIMPPPNITGNLHMGHAFQQTIMDILIRYHRMQGYNTLWQMGVDHAGIATQILVSKQIKLQYGKDLQEFGRRNFLNQCLKWKKENDFNINYQIKRLGSSVDWNRIRFTLDDISKQGVKKAFINLYDHGLIYRKKKLSNWDIKLQTVLSDLEIEHRSILGNMWNIKYFLVDNSGKINRKEYLIISTTRPETLLGDTAIAVHPDDIRYINFVGLFVMVPIINRIIPVISDSFVDMKKGTGCVKITPAHDVNDYDVAIRKKLPLINIFTTDGKICNTCSVYDINGCHTEIYDTELPQNLKGLTRLQARKKILSILQDEKILDSIIKTNIIVLYGDRSGSEIECMLTDQWYLRTKKLSQQAIKAVQDGQIVFFPKQYKNLYLSWMNNIQDWCISRQLWWGHRIPAWYDNLGNIYVGYDEQHIRMKYVIPKDRIITRELDVLDTWFSSSLWSFLSLDWPKNKKLLQNFHPTNVLVSGFDIIFFWIARMIMMTMHLLKDKSSNPQIPFKNVYITGLIKDEFGQKMSKSKGNVLDPLDVIDGISLKNLLKKRTINSTKTSDLKKILNNTNMMFPEGIKGFGADALRFTFSSYSSITRNMNWDINQLQGYRNFCNKIWNAGRFILMNIRVKNLSYESDNNFFAFFDVWILSELNNTIQLYRTELENYRFDLSSNVLYNFFWHKFCDWYLEISKVIFEIGTSQEIQRTKYVLVYVFEIFLRMAHPMIPFITEYIWKKIKNLLFIKENTIMLQRFPITNFDMICKDTMHIMTCLQKIILFVRKTRITFNINNNILLHLFISGFNITFKKVVELNHKIIKKFTFLEKIDFVNINYHIPDHAVVETIYDNKIFFVFDGQLNNQVMLHYKKQKINQLNKKIFSLNKILSNKVFLDKAPKDIVNAKQVLLKQLIQHRDDTI
ncbi:Valine--tRNA ligase [Buchnera aphidicola (Takecallis arundicolens)]|uniref:valine--tRNA ligase n=1 Tax=Buchnera aphidicola TaxID=9 RepID=UPI003463D14B